jgi:hypothetical protein
MFARASVVLATCLAFITLAAAPASASRQQDPHKPATNLRSYGDERLRLRFVLSGAEQHRGNLAANCSWVGSLATTPMSATFAGSPEPATGGRSPGSRRRKPFLELLALTGLAIAQPVLDVFGGGADVFVTLGAGRLDVVIFAVTVAVGPALLLWLIELLIGAVDGRARRWIHGLFVAALAALVVVQLGKQLTQLPGRVVLVGAVAAGAAAALVVARSAGARLFLRYLAAAPAVFVVLFLVASPARSLIFPSSTDLPPSAPPRTPAPVVMLVLDELPTSSLLDGEGGIDAGLFPNLAGLADDATWYRNHTVAAPITTLSLPALLTGRWPTGEDQLPLVDEHPENLFTWLGANYDLHVAETVTRLCPAVTCAEPATDADAALPVLSLLGRAVDVWRDLAWPRQEVPSVFNLTDPDADFRFDAFVESLDTGGDTQLHFHHSLLPHQPWTRLPSGQGHGAPDVPDGTFFDIYSTDEAADVARQRHILQMQHTDRLVGDALDRLRELDRYDESLVVVTADHGVSFRRGGRARSVDEDNYHDILWAPLFVKAPGQQVGDVSDAEVGAIDVLPTIAEHLGATLPWRVDGTSMLDEGRTASGHRPMLTSWADELPGDDRIKVVDGPAGYAQVLRGRSTQSDGPDELRPYQRGRYGELVGMRADDLIDAGSSSRQRAVLDRPERYDDVDPDADVIPAYVSGTIEVDGRTTVAVAVNGTVGGTFTIEAVPDDGSASRFWTLVPPELLRPGANLVELYVVHGGPATPRLAPLTSFGP